MEDWLWIFIALVPLFTFLSGRNRSTSFCVIWRDKLQNFVPRTWIIERDWLYPLSCLIAAMLLDASDTESCLVSWFAERTWICQTSAQLWFPCDDGVSAPRELSWLRENLKLHFATEKRNVFFFVRRVRRQIRSQDVSMRKKLLYHFLVHLHFSRYI